MCKLTFDRGWEVCTDVPGAFPGSIGADVVGMQTFFAIPVNDEGRMIGTVCGASAREVPIDEPQLTMLRLIGDAVASQLAAHERAANAETEALTDPLTSLLNRRGFDRRREAERARAERHGQATGLALFDIDHFKQCNDTYGHAGGDIVLQAFAESLRSCARLEDVPARLGGDEFALLLIAGDSVAAAAVAERVRVDFAAATAALGMPCSVSVGVTATDITAPDDLDGTADRALYAAKANGRRHVVVSTPTPHRPACMTLP